MFGSPFTPSGGGGLTLYTNANNLYRKANPIVTTRFDALINGAPTNAVNSVVTFDTVTAGGVSSLTPSAAGQLAKMKLFNLTRGNYALIESAAGLTVTMDRNVTTLSNPWADNDVITNFSPVIGAGGGFSFCELEVVDPVLMGKSGLVLDITCRSGVTSEILALHPCTLWAQAKEQDTTAQVVGLSQTRTVIIPLINNTIGLAWQGVNYTAMIIKIEGYL